MNNKKPEDPIRINDKEYQFDDLPPMTQASIVAVQNIDGTLNGLSQQMDLLQMARQGYIDRINKTIEEIPDGDPE